MTRIETPPTASHTVGSPELLIVQAVNGEFRSEDARADAILSIINTRGVDERVPLLRKVMEICGLDTDDPTVPPAVPGQPLSDHHRETLLKNMRPYAGDAVEQCLMNESNDPDQIAQLLESYVFSGGTNPPERVALLANILEIGASRGLFPYTPLPESAMKAIQEAAPSEAKDPETDKQVAVPPGVRAQIRRIIGSETLSPDQRRAALAAMIVEADAIGEGASVLNTIIDELSRNTLIPEGHSMSVVSIGSLMNPCMIGISDGLFGRRSDMMQHVERIMTQCGAHRIA